MHTVHELHFIERRPTLIPLHKSMRKSVFMSHGSFFQWEGLLAFHMLASRGKIYLVDSVCGPSILATLQQIHGKRKVAELLNLENRSGLSTLDTCLRSHSKLAPLLRAHGAENRSAPPPHSTRHTWRREW